MAFTEEQAKLWQEYGTLNPPEEDHRREIAEFKHLCWFDGGGEIPSDEDVREAFKVRPVLSELHDMKIDARTDEEWEAAIQYLKDHLGCSDQFSRDYIGVVRAREEADGPRPAPVPRG